MTIRGQAFPRAGLVGNPSDGYFGKTISFTFRNFVAAVTLEESGQAEILEGPRDRTDYHSGGARLLKAAIEQFRGHCARNNIRLRAQEFTLAYETSIPEQLGLAGSSAIITACFRALMEFYGVEIAPPVLANLVLWSETRELGISAGLQDRVAQVYDGLIYMDFDKSRMERDGFGRYERLDPARLPPLYIAYRTELAEGTEVFHNNVRARWEGGEPAVVEAMKTWASLAEQVRDLLARGRGREIGPLLDANFDLRRRMYKISEGNLRLVETARATGASAKFTGSGGAIVGTYEDDAMYRRLEAALAPLGAQLFKPDYAPAREIA